MILVDDGLATGSTMRAAVQALRQQRPKRLVVAVPVGAAETCAELRAEADEVVCAVCPRNFGSVGSWYEDFRQTPDAFVQALLEQASQRHSDNEVPRRHTEECPMNTQSHHASTQLAPARSRFEDSVQIDTAAGVLEGSLAIPEPAVGAVIFAHGSGSSRHSPRNRYVAEVLHRAGLATLLVDLLDRRRGPPRLDHGRVSLRHRTTGRSPLGRDRLAAAHRAKHDFRLGYFGASTGAAAALVAAAHQPSVAAVVSRGGRPDLALRPSCRASAPPRCSWSVGGRAGD